MLENLFLYKISVTAKTIDIEMYDLVAVGRTEHEALTHVKNTIDNWEHHNSENYNYSVWAKRPANSCI